MIANLRPSFHGLPMQRIQQISPRKEDRRERPKRWIEHTCINDGKLGLLTLFQLTDALNSIQLLCTAASSFTFTCFCIYKYLDASQLLISLTIQLLLSVRGGGSSCSCRGGGDQHSSMEKVNTELAQRNCYIMEQNERLKKAAQLLQQERHKLLSQLRSNARLSVDSKRQHQDAQDGSKDKAADSSSSGASKQE